ncbi:hypothetical protein [Chryseobacterium caseinilyticum]|uniref:Uncharacterized protein n=1 Tax=Chryseobacterium caseinilyticum TaxID=2771428 RepID=A0ABR8ZGW0_9FLAO|nr:hypothetical protein [Chryseobacterium caseinilyticum]MBD8084546.1 hypothetical protein [Chryseobacterium caseinilyticum]
MTVKIIKFSQLLRLVRPVFLTLTLFQSLFLTAQKNTCPENNTPKIVILDGAKVYSSDSGFNTQTASVKLSPKESDYPYRIKKTSDRNLIKFIRKSEKQKQYVNPDVAITKITKNKSGKEKRKTQKLRKSYKDFGFLKLYHLPSRDRLSHADTFSTDYIAPVQNSQYQFKPGIYEIQVAVKKALGYLHFKKYPNYNNRSFDFCFSKFYSVRPPPTTEII